MEYNTIPVYSHYRSALLSQRRHAQHERVWSFAAYILAVFTVSYFLQEYLKYLTHWK